MHMLSRERYRFAVDRREGHMKATRFMRWMSSRAPGRTLIAGGLVWILLTGTALAAPGDLDPSWGTKGLTRTAVAPEEGADFQNGLVIRSNGSVLVGGSSDMGEGQGGFNFRILGYTKRGVLDLSWGQGGVTATKVSPGTSTDFLQEHIWALAAQPDGKIVASGHADEGAGVGGINFALARYTSDGVLDPSFGGDGIVTTAMAPGDNTDRALGVLVQPDGKIVAIGGARQDADDSQESTEFALARYNADGTLDSGFGDGGRAYGTLTGGVPVELVLQPDGKIVVVGQVCVTESGTSCRSAVARYNSDGSPDVSFGGTGVVVTDVIEGFFDSFFDAALQSDGKILGAGPACTGVSGRTCDFLVVRYNADGSLDTSFGGDGIVTLALGPPNHRDVAESIALDPLGRIVAAGASGPTGASGNFALARFNPDGTLDPSFGSGGIVITPTSDPAGGYDEIFNVGIDKTGKIVAAGECDRPETGTDVCVVRYKGSDD